MKKHMLQLTVVMLAGGAVAAAAQQPTHPMQMQMQSKGAMPCMMAMHGMMMGEGMGGGMMPPDHAQMGAMRGMNDSSRMHEKMNDAHMRGMMSDSAQMAHMRSDLGLTDAQMQQLRGIVERACTAAQPHMKLAMQAHQAAAQALEGDNPNLDHFEDQLENAAKHMVAAQVEMAKGMIEARKSLTPAQRQKLDQMHKQMMTQAGMAPLP